MTRMLTADKVSRACVLVAFSAAEVKLVLISLVYNQVGVAERDLAFGELK